MQSLIEEAERAGKAYRYSLQDMGADTEEEKVAATWALTAHQKYQSGDYEGAVEAFQRSLEIAPNFSAIYRNWAIMQADAGFFDHAEELMQKAVRIDPDDPRLWFAWGNVEKTRQRYDKAAQYFRRALDLSPNDYPILGALGEIEKRKGNFQEAAILLLRSINAGNTRWSKIVGFTSLADNLRRWAEDLLKDKNVDGALERLNQAYEAGTKAVELGPDMRARTTLANVSYELGKLLVRHSGFESGSKYLKQAVISGARKHRERKITQDACYRLVSHFLQNGDLEQAKEYFTIGRSALIEQGKFAEAYRALEAEFTEERARGRLKCVKSKGYGFIEQESEGADAYLHFSQVIPRIAIEDFAKLEGSVLSFSLRPGKYGRSSEAIRARIIDLKSD